MSRVGLKPIPIPSGVTVTFKGFTATVKGPKGEITRELPDLCDFHQDGDVMRVTRKGETRRHREIHGLTRALVNNMVVGVSEGFFKELESVGVGYKAELKGKDLVLTLGFSHPIVHAAPEGITFEVSAPTKIKVSGIVKEAVGQHAAEIRSYRPPEPYKGKGIKYVGEHIQRKSGKAAAGAGA